MGAGTTRQCCGVLTPTTFLVFHDSTGSQVDVRAAYIKLDLNGPARWEDAYRSHSLTNVPSHVVDRW